MKSAHRTFEVVLRGEYAMRINLDWIKLEPIKACIQIGYGVMLLGLVLFLSPEIKGAARMLVARFDSATALEVAGLKLTFTDASISRGFDLVKITASNPSAVAKAVRELDSKQFIRLMTVGVTSTSCEYEYPKPEMRSAIAHDHELADMGLARIVWKKDLLLETSARRETEIRAGKAWEIGMPVRCYEMTLTGPGADVKTAIVTQIAPAFNGVAPESAPATAPKVTAMN
jgi:hypothetical protein